LLIEREGVRQLPFGRVLWSEADGREKRDNPTFRREPIFQEDDLETGQFSRLSAISA
jgi:hypothetical protein